MKNLFKLNKIKSSSSDTSYYERLQAKSGSIKENDRQIWENFRKGDEAAFNYIYRSYVADLFNFGCNVTFREQLVQDAIQNIFIDIRKKRERLGEVQNIKAYLFKVLYRELIKNLEKENRFIIKEQGIDETGFEVELSSEEKIIRHELNLEKRDKVENLLNSLTKRQREALLLFYVEGFSYQELAKALEFKNSKSARDLVYRALAAAKDTLKK